LQSSDHGLASHFVRPWLVVEWRDVIKPNHAIDDVSPPSSEGVVTAPLMSSTVSKSSSKQQPKSSTSATKSTSGQSATNVTTAQRHPSSATTGGRVPRSSSAATTSTPRPGSAKSSTVAARHVNGNDATASGSEISVSVAGRSKSSQNRQVIKAEIHETGVSHISRPVQPPASGVDERSSAVGCRQALSGSSPAMTVDSGATGRERQRFQSLTAASAQVQSHIDANCSSVVDAMSQTPRTEEELEKMRILARHVKVSFHNISLHVITWFMISITARSYPVGTSCSTSSLIRAHACPGLQTTTTITWALRK